MTQNLLITGFPNAKSRVLLRRLLREPAGGTLFVLLAAQAEAEAQSLLDSVEPGAARRVVLLEGRAGAIDMGLSGEEYRALARKVAVVHHLDTLTNPSVDRELAERVNVAGARELIEFARIAFELERIVFYSSALAGGERRGSVLETESQPQQKFHSPAARALAQAEHMLFSQEQALPLTVLRPSLLSCDSTTGETDRENPLSQLVALLLRSPSDWPVFMPATGDGVLNLVPIDFLIDAALHIARRTDAVGKIFHVTDPEPPRVQQLFDWVRARAGGSGGVRTVPVGVGKALFSAPGPLSWAHTPRVLLDLMTTEVRYDTSNTDAALVDSGLRCPPFESYVDRFVERLRRRPSRSPPSAADRAPVAFDERGDL